MPRIIDTLSPLERLKCGIPFAADLAWVEGLQARVDELSRAYAVRGLAIEELTSERDRYREALERISRDNLGYAYLSIAREALEPTK